MTRILFLTYVNPYTLLAGDNIYTVNLLDSFLALGCQVDLLYYNSNPLEPEIPTHRAKDFHRTKALPFSRKSNLRLVFSSYPGMVASRKTAAYEAAVSEWTAAYTYDLAVINHLRMGFVVDALPANLPKLYASHNAEYLLSINNFRNEKWGLKKAVYFWDAWRTGIFERKMMEKVDAFTAICEYDLDYLKGLHTAPSAVLRPVLSTSTRPLHTLEQFEAHVKNLMVVGSYTWGPKAQNIRALVRAFAKNNMIAKGFQLTVVGRIEPELALQLKQICPHVDVTGRVEDLEGYYDEHSIALIPEVMGGGFKLKVAEAGLRKKAVFAVRGAITRTNLEAGIHFMERDTLDELMQALVDETQDVQRLWKMAQSGYTVISTEYTQQALSEQLKNLLP